MKCVQKGRRTENLILARKVRLEKRVAVVMQADSFDEWYPIRVSGDLGRKGTYLERFYPVGSQTDFHRFAAPDKRVKLVGFILWRALRGVGTVRVVIEKHP